MRLLPRIGFVLLVLALSCCAASAAGDNADARDLHPYKGSGAPSAQLAPPDASERAERPAPALAYAVAVSVAVLVLCLICVPSRKPESSTSR